MNELVVWAVVLAIIILLFLKFVRGVVKSVMIVAFVVFVVFAAFMLIDGSVTHIFIRAEKEINSSTLLAKAEDLWYNIKLALGI